MAAKEYASLGSRFYEGFAKRYGRHLGPSQRETARVLQVGKHVLANGLARIGGVWRSQSVLSAGLHYQKEKKKGRWSHVSTVGFPNLVNLASTARTVSMTLTASCG